MRRSSNTQHLTDKLTYYYQIDPIRQEILPADTRLRNTLNVPGPT
ncbi:hypothetical protein [Hymenobacter daeguensis]